MHDGLRVGESPVKTLLLLILTLTALFGQETIRPACTAETRGQVWPPQAARNPSAVGPLCNIQVCVRGAWSFHWESLTVHVSELGKKRSQPAQVSGAPVGRATGCGVPVEGRPMAKHSESHARKQVDGVGGTGAPGLAQVVSRE